MSNSKISTSVRFNAPENRLTGRPKDRGVESFSVCAGCKNTVYCSKQCQVASWPVHKVTCGLSQTTLSGKSEFVLKASGFIQWYVRSSSITFPYRQLPLAALTKRVHGRITSHSEILCHAAICALNLGYMPTNVDTYLLVIGFKERPDAAARSRRDRFVPTCGFRSTFDNAKAMLRPSKPLSDKDMTMGLKQSRLSHEAVKRNGGFGVITLLLILRDGVQHVHSYSFPKGDTAWIAQQAEDWGEDWLERLKMALEYPVLRQGFLRHYKFPPIRPPATP
ncbi:hypothetical protein EVG20_g2992 [Dentipellis fragilis]|uniref:MYND-type domain-containing protein n=1 Tax=Dentipellis fragilis TaxID=205917 RepID=A0A4Y9Z6Z7_9AGAM|nr:hypothetical protein EVG20_g2992 [Dentipellis fragilis]